MLRGGKLYIIWNDINDKVYVGITSRRLSRRFHEHVYASLNHKDKFQFHSAIRKYGEEHFTWNACLTMFLLKDYLCLRKPVLNTLIRIKTGTIQLQVAMAQVKK